MFKKIKSQMIKKWLEHETTDVHPMLNDAESLTDLYDYFNEVLSGGGLEDFLESYELSIINNKKIGYEKTNIQSRIIQQSS